MKTILTRVVLIFISTGLFLVGAEVICRLLLPAMRYGVNSDAEFTHDPLLGWRGIPGYQGHYPLTGEEISINSQGFRDEEWSLKLERARTGHLRKILFIGDSMTYGYEVDKEDRIGEQLRHMFLLEGEGVECFNAGIPAFGTDQEWLVLEHYQDLIQPDIVVLRFCVNDFGDCALPYCWATPAFRVYRPYFDLQGEQVLNTVVPRRFSLHMADRWGGKLRLWRLVDMLENAVTDARYRLKGVSPNRRIPLKPGDVYGRHVWDMGCMSLCPAFRDLYDANKERVFCLIRKMKTFCDAHEATFIVGTEYLPEAEENHPHRELDRSLKSVGIRHVDFLKENTRPGWSWVNHDGHANFLQNHFAALELFKEITGKESKVLFSTSKWHPSIAGTLNLGTPTAHRQIVGEGWGKPEKFEGIAGRWLNGQGRLVLRSSGGTAGGLRFVGNSPHAGTVLEMNDGADSSAPVRCALSNRFDVALSMPLEAEEGLVFASVEFSQPVFMESIGLVEK